MRPINNVVDASNYVMLELGQPDPSLRPRPAGRRRPPGPPGTAGEPVTTLDGVVRTLGRPGPGLGDTGQDCLICDADGRPVGIGGVMGGASSEIGPDTTRVLLEAAYFVPMAIARTSKRLNLRTEASARFERGCDPAGIDRAADRFCELLALTAGAAPDRGRRCASTWWATCPRRSSSRCGRPGSTPCWAPTCRPPTSPTLLRPPRAWGPAPTGIGAATRWPSSCPTFRPDIRPAPMGEADLAEEVARTYGYARLPRRTPSWPEPGRLHRYQRERRRLKDVLCGLGA